MQPELVSEPSPNYSLCRTRKNSVRFPTSQITRETNGIRIFRKDGLERLRSQGSVNCFTNLTKTVSLHGLQFRRFENSVLQT